MTWFFGTVFCLVYLRSGIDPIHLTYHQNNLGCAILVVNVNVCYSVKCAFYAMQRLHVNPLTTNMVSVASVTACDACASGHSLRNSNVSGNLWSCRSFSNVVFKSKSKTMNGSLEKSLTGPKEVQLAFGKRTTVQREWHLCLLIQSQFLLQEKNTSLLFSG